VRVATPPARDRATAGLHLEATTPAPGAARGVRFDDEVTDLRPEPRPAGKGLAVGELVQALEQASFTAAETVRGSCPR
jgi:hypothetical protein